MSLPESRCPLTQPERKTIYDTFERYQAYKAEQGKFDDAERVLFLIRQILSHPVGKRSDAWLDGRPPFDFAAIDEVQDSTYAEISLVPNTETPVSKSAQNC